jgi:glutamate:GABA antiporter
MPSSKKKLLSIFMLCMINVAAICNIANLTFTAQKGFGSLFYYALSSIIFFIPVGLAAAELASGWPHKGGVYYWVREALGEKAGFVAIWLQWVENVIWYPTLLAFVASTFAYIFNPSLAANKFYIMSVVLITFWLITFLNTLGMKISAWISTLCVILGTLIPGSLLIFMGLANLGSPSSQLSFSWSALIPSFSFSFDSFSVLAAVLLSLGGLEMSGVHAADVENPKKDYPRAILFSSLIIFALLSLASLSIASVVPKEKLELASGTIEAFRLYFQQYGVGWVLPIISFLIVIGSIGLISTWTIGPTKGLLATAQHGELPPLLQKVNKKGMPTSLLLLQALTVTFLSFTFFLMPTVSSTYRLLFYLAALLYLIMYILMFLALIVLRYKEPSMPRPFKVPFGKVGVWTLSSLGIFGALFAIVCGFIPNEALEKQHLVFFELFLSIGLLFFCGIPIVIHSMKKPSWHISKEE